MTDRNPFFCGLHNSSPSMLPVLYWYTPSLALSSLSSIGTVDAATAASLSHTANARSKSGVGAAPATPPASPLPPFHKATERSKRQSLALNCRSKSHRFFPAILTTRVRRGSKLLRMWCWKKTEKLKIVQFSCSSAFDLSPHPASKIVSRNFVATHEACSEKNLQESYAVSLNWQYALHCADHTMEVAA